jgi:hypothetical protein
VSGVVTKTSSTGMPSSSATTWRTPVVTAPVPISAAELTIVTVPSSLSFTEAAHGPGFVAQVTAAMPTPRSGGRVPVSSAHGASASTRSKPSSSPASTSSWPLTMCSPSRRTLRSRNARRSMPISVATWSRCDSSAHSLNTPATPR